MTDREEPMPNATWTEGWLPDGTHFHIDGDPYAGTGRLRINGELAELTCQPPGRRAGPRAVSRLRDGGTTHIHTTQGTFVAHRAIGREHYDSFNGERLLTEPPA